MRNTLMNSNMRQSDVNTKFSGTNLLLKSEEFLKNYHHFIVDKFVKYSPSSSDAKVLDFGAGIGTLAEIFFNAVGLKPECVEIDPDQRKIIEQRGYKSHAGLDQINEKYDFIFSSNVLEHIEDDMSSLAAIRSKLRMSGTLVIFVPAFEIIWSAMDDRMGHYRRYSKKMVLEKLVQSGYTVKDIRYCDSFGFILSLLFKYVGSKSGEPSSVSLRIFDSFLLPISKVVDVLVFGKFGKNLIAVATLNQSHDSGQQKACLAPDEHHGS